MFIFISNLVAARKKLPYNPHSSDTLQLFMRVAAANLMIISASLAPAAKSGLILFNEL